MSRFEGEDPQPAYLTSRFLAAANICDATRKGRKPGKRFQIKLRGGHYCFGDLVQKLPSPPSTPERKCLLLRPLALNLCTLANTAPHCSKFRLLPLSTGCEKELGSSYNWKKLRAYWIECLSCTLQLGHSYMHACRGKTSHLICFFLFLFFRLYYW